MKRTIFVSVFLLAAFSPPLHAGLPSCNFTPNKPQKLLACVTVDSVREHQAAFQIAADANGGTRATGWPGYDQSVSYVAQQLAAAGYQVQLNSFDFPYTPPSILQQLTPFAATYETGAFNGSGAGEVTGIVIPVDLALSVPNLSTSACEPADFAGLDFSGPADIALIQRGTCNFSVKAVNAQAAGAEAVIIFNQGNEPSRMGLIVGNADTLPDGTPSNLTIPVVGASFNDGVALAQAAATAFIKVETTELRSSTNVIAQLAGKVANNVVMAGAHLDSVPQGPGIQDNGSGSAALLEVALQLASTKPRNTIRFAWWGGGELGDVGATSYLEGLTVAQRANIALYLNFDSIGSPNYVLFVQDLDSLLLDLPPGTSEIRAFFESFYTQAGHPFKRIDSALLETGWVPFLSAGIPVGGITTGTTEIKTAEEESIWGGTAGDQYDPCYHLACDTFDNISLKALDINSDAAAAAILQFGMSTQTINGMPGKGNFNPRPAMPNQ